MVISSESDVDIVLEKVNVFKLEDKLKSKFS